jgi:hypothetical protein
MDVSSIAMTTCYDEPLAESFLNRRAHSRAPLAKQLTIRSDAEIEGDNADVILLLVLRHSIDSGVTVAKRY